MSCAFVTVVGKLPVRRPTNSSFEDSEEAIVQFDSTVWPNSGPDPKAFVRRNGSELFQAMNFSMACLR